MEQLDRVYTNVDWLDQYPEALITHLPKTHTELNPILVCLKGNKNLN